MTEPRRPQSLVVLVDGEPMPEAEARALWERFSAWMEDHRGDLGGFAAQEGFVSVHPGIAGGKPVLNASRSEAQGVYAPARSFDPVGRTGSSGFQGSQSAVSGMREKAQEMRRKRRRKR